MKAQGSLIWVSRSKARIGPFPQRTLISLALGVAFNDVGGPRSPTQIASLAMTDPAFDYVLP
jgi:hypothetical protein